MEARPQATFIPKKPVTSVDVGNKGLGFLSLIALIIFLSTVISAGGIYFYKQTLVKSIAARDAQLEASKKKFDKSFISFIVRLNKRIDASKQLLNKHVAVSSIFRMLQESTLQTVQFSNFSFAGIQAGNAPALRLTLSGVAKDYNSLAAQAEYFGKIKQMREQVFSNFSLTQEGRVSFNFDAVIDPGLVDYKSRSKGSLFDIEDASRRTINLASSTPSGTSSTSTRVSTTTNVTQP